MGEKDFLWIEGWVYLSPNSKIGHFVLGALGIYYSLCGDYRSLYPPETLTILVSPKKKCEPCILKLIEISMNNVDPVVGI